MGDADQTRSRFLPCFIPMILFSGYVIPYPTIPWVFKPLYYLSPMQWGMSLLNTINYSDVVFSDCPSDVAPADRTCFATGEELIKACTAGLPLSSMFAICLVYILSVVYLNIAAVRKHVINGRA